jgi:TonB family protein
MNRLNPVRRRIQGLKLLFPATLLIVASTSAQQPPVQNPNLLAVVSEVTVERMGCFGVCPVYMLTLRRQGASTYIGKRSVARIGQYTVNHVYGGDLDQLSKAISDFGFFDLQSENGGPEDAEQVAVTVTTPLQSKTVKTLNFAAAPFALWAVVMLADGMAANLVWENRNQLRFPTITGPVLIRKIEPEYTEEARTAKLQGVVWVQVEVQADGKVATEHIFVVHGLGMGLDEKAIEAVKQWTFRPATKDGNTISMATTVQVAFRL